MNQAIYPGRTWLDTNGKRIQAHGGSMFYENGMFYWYGENKERTIPGSGIWHWGVRCYSSKDLYNWKDEGLIIAPDTEDASSPLHPASYLDRPHILRNDKTGKYVCWIKFSGMEQNSHYFTILTADRFLGPYEIAVPALFPCGAVVGDFDLQKDEKTGKAYLFAETDVYQMTSYTLTEDYLNVEEECFHHLVGRYREGPAHFMRNGKHYIITSGRTGYIPNPSEWADSEDWHGPYTVQGNPHIHDESEASFNSQISCVFKHPLKKDLYIAMADRWVPSFPVSKGMSSKIWGIIVSIYKKNPVSKEDMEWFNALPMMDGVNTSIADYVWLPLRFEGNRLCIDWKDAWQVEDYE